MGYFHPVASTDRAVVCSRLETVREVLRFDYVQIADYVGLSYHIWRTYEIGSRKTSLDAYLRLLGRFVIDASTPHDARVLISYLVTPAEYGIMRYRNEVVVTALKQLQRSNRTCWFLEHGSIMELLVHLRLSVLKMSRAQIVRCTSITESLIKQPENVNVRPSLRYALTLMSLVDNPVNAWCELFQLESHEEFIENYLPRLKPSTDTVAFIATDLLTKQTKSKLTHSG
jgi:hypothetical protein